MTVLTIIAAPLAYALVSAIVFGVVKASYPDVNPYDLPLIAAMCWPLIVPVLIVVLAWQHKNNPMKLIADFARKTTESILKSKDQGMESNQPEENPDKEMREAIEEVEELLGTDKKLKIVHNSGPLLGFPNPNQISTFVENLVDSRW